MPSNLKLPSGLSNPNIVFTNMNIHTSTICLHQAAIYKADKNHLPASISAESKVRCISAANEVASIMRMISHLDLSAVSSSGMTPRSNWQLSDESIHFVLLVCSSESFCPIPQKSAGWQSDRRFSPVSSVCNECIEEEEPADRVFLGSTGCWSWRTWYEEPKI